MKPLDPSRPISGYVHGLRYGSEAPSRYFQVIVYPTVEAMRAAAQAYDKRRGGTHHTAFFGDALGVFHPTWNRSKYDKKAKKWVDTTPCFAGVMRLVQGNVTRETVAHECIHAVLTITRMETWRVTEDGGGAADFGDSCDDREESFAYLLSETIVAVEGMIDGMHERAGIVRALS